MRETDVVENSEFYEFIDEEKNAVRASLSDLKGEGLIEKPDRAEYALDYENLEDALDRIDESDGD